jgi:6-pyruvoyltetrahydropterin/6-carboxytetrahydropterin synthase
MRIYKEFHFEAAHHLPTAPPGHRNARMHGHSFRVRVSIDGEPDPETGLVMDLEELARALAEARDELDHRLLNDVPGLEAPTLERIAAWLWNRLGNKVPGLAEILIARDSCQEGSIMTVPPRRSRLAAE